MLGVISEGSPPAPIREAFKASPEGRQEAGSVETWATNEGVRQRKNSRRGTEVGAYLIR